MRVVNMYRRGVSVIGVYCCCALLSSSGCTGDPANTPTTADAGDLTVLTDTSSSTDDSTVQDDLVSDTSDTSPDVPPTPADAAMRVALTSGGGMFKSEAHLLSFSVGQPGVRLSSPNYQLTLGVALR